MQIFDERNAVRGCGNDRCLQTSINLSLSCAFIKSIIMWNGTLHGKKNFLSSPYFGSTTLRYHYTLE